ncbi:MAG: hypothetical protein ACRDPM_02630 [Solirubrobacteraceae bacterium]
MNELRREMLGSSDAPAELSADLTFLASRQASLAALMLDHAEHYKVLYTAARQHGTSEEIQTAALDAAGNLGTVLQSLRSREDLQVALAHAPGYTPTPLIAVDQLFFSFTLLAAGGGDSLSALEELDAALPPEGVDELFRSQRVRDWLHGLGELAPGE